MNYEKAFKIIASHIDASVNTNNTEISRLSHQLLAYWFKQVIEYRNDVYRKEGYITKITNESKCHSFGMYDFLVEERLIVNAVPCAACNYAEGNVSVYGTLYCTSCAQV